MIPSEIFRALLILLLALRPALASAQGPAQGASAEELYEGGEYKEAARLWEAEGSSSGLFNAGMARQGAGQDSLAIARWEQYLAQAPAISPAESADLEQRIQAARQRTLVVRVIVEGAGASRELALSHEGRAEDMLRLPWPQGQRELLVDLDPGTWTAELVGDPAVTPQKLEVVAGSTNELRFTAIAPTPVQPSAVDLRVTPTRALRRGVEVYWQGPGPQLPAQTLHAAGAWRLSPGTWNLQLRARGFEALQRSIVVGAQPLALSVTLQPDRRQRARVGLVAGLSAAAVVFAGVGTALVVVGKQGIDATRDDWSPGSPETWRAAAVPIETLTDGVGLLGASVGAMIPALVAAKRSSERAPRIAAGVGAALFAGSLSWYLSAVFRPLQPGEGFHLWPSQVASGLLGASTMVLTGALLDLVTEKLVLRRRGATRARRGAVQGVVFQKASEKHEQEKIQ